MESLGPTRRFHGGELNRPRKKIQEVSYYFRMNSLGKQIEKDRAIIAILIFILLSLCAQALIAGERGPCLAKACADLKPNDSIKIVENGGKEIEGCFVSANIDLLTLTMRQIKHPGLDTTYNLSEISKIKYKKIKLRPALMVLGIGLGSYFGVMVATSGSEKGGGNFSRKDVTTIFACAGVGLALGTLISLNTPLEVTVSCEP